jgi:predicted nucleic acid-binding protein
MVLVDTSVLIGYLKGLNNEKTEKFDLIIENNVPYGINNYIYQELLQGASSEKEFETLRKYFLTQKFYDVKKGSESFEEAAHNYFQCRKAGVTVKSTIDMIIVQTALENNLFLLHYDSDFTRIAGVIKKLKIY